MFLIELVIIYRTHQQFENEKPEKKASKEANSPLQQNTKQKMTFSELKRQCPWLYSHLDLTNYVRLILIFLK